MCSSGALSLFCLLLACAHAEAAASSSVASERQSLIALFEALSGPQWLNSTNWNTAAPICDWAGIQCDNAVEHVVELTLGGNQLSGQLPVGLCFPWLTKLDLSNNSLSAAASFPFDALEAL